MDQLYTDPFLNASPKVALLNIGSEEIKGTNVIKKLIRYLKKLSKNGDFNI